MPCNECSADISHFCVRCGVDFCEKHIVGHDTFVNCETCKQDTCTEQMGDNGIDCFRCWAKFKYEYNTNLIKKLEEKYNDLTQDKNN